MSGSSNKVEVISGVALLISAVIAIFVANSSWNIYYNALLSSDFVFSLLGVEVHKTFLEFVNDALMVIFFLMIGLEIKKELLVGELSSKDKYILPVIGAIGGAILPALTFLLINWGEQINQINLMSGWAIPTATDIAFVLAIISVLSSRVPSALKVFLVTLAVIDDMIAVVVIALFYTHDINFLPLIASFAMLLFLFSMNLRNHRGLGIYITLGILIWLGFLISGVHPTVAGVLIGLTIPLRIFDKEKKEVVFEHNNSPSENFAHALNMPVKFLILPVFAFCNAGVDMSGMTWADVLSPLSLGIALALFLGKQVGVFSAVAIAFKLGIKRNEYMTWSKLYSISILTGIGFTMSLFIGGLAFSDVVINNQVKVGVFSGSLASALYGSILLLLSKPVVNDHKNSDHKNIDLPA